MKKFFRNLATASAAVLGVFVSSCHLEGIQTTFKTDPAKAEITVNVLDGLTGQDVSSTAVLEYSSTANSVIKREGNKLILEGNKALQEQVVSIHAEFSGRTGDAQVIINEVLPGGRAYYSATIVCGKPTIEVARLNLALTALFNDYVAIDVKNVTKDTKFTVTDELDKDYTVETPSYSEDEKLVQIVSQAIIPAHTFTVKAEYDGKVLTKTVETEEVMLNGDATHYSVFTFGEKPEPGQPVRFVALLHAFDETLPTENKEIDPKAPYLSYSLTRTYPTKNTVDVVFNERLGYWTLVATGDAKTLKVEPEDVTVYAYLHEGSAQQRMVSVKCHIPECTEDNTASAFRFMFESEPFVDYADLTMILNAYLDDLAKGERIDVTTETAFTVIDENGTPYVVYSPEYAPGQKQIRIATAEAIPAHKFTIVAKYAEFEKTWYNETSPVDVSEAAAYYTSTVFVREPEPVDPVQFAVVLKSFDDAAEAEYPENEIDPESKDVEYSFSRSNPSNNDVQIVFSQTSGHWELLVTGNSETKHVEAETITVKATHFPGTAQEEVLTWRCTVPKLSQSIPPTTHEFLFNSAFEYDFTPYEPETKVVVGNFFSTHGHATFPYPYSHAQIGHGHGEGDGNWLVNETEFMLETTVKYDATYGQKVDVAYDMTKISMAEFRKLKDLEKLYNTGVNTEEKTLDIKVSAFAMYTAYATKTTISHDFDIVRVKTRVKVGGGTLYKYSTQAEYVEAAIPGHEGHYHYGHGHADTHGYSGNAGGGIIWAD